MENSMSRMLIEAVVRRALKSIKDDPERRIRNLIDMALQFSNGRFQKDFFSAAQSMLQNENSAYYGLIRDVVSYTDLDRLYTFGMNLGYNGCTMGAKVIRDNEVKLNCNIPWAITARLDMDRFAEKEQNYHALIREGESLGIYIWMLFAMQEPQKALVFAREHLDSAFCIFCEAGDLTDTFLEETAELYNVMLVVRYEESATDLFATLRKMGLLYSVWYSYGQKDIETVISGDLFTAVQQVSPAFTVLVPEETCPGEIRHLVSQAAVRVRGDQTYRTIVWELQSDNRMVDTIISGDACSVYFDEEGNCHVWDKELESTHQNLFQTSLSDILINGFPKETGNGKCRQAVSCITSK